MGGSYLFVQLNPGGDGSFGQAVYYVHTVSPTTVAMDPRNLSRNK